MKTNASLFIDLKCYWFVTTNLLTHFKWFFQGCQAWTDWENSLNAFKLAKHDLFQLFLISIFMAEQMLRAAGDIILHVWRKHYATLKNGPEILFCLPKCYCQWVWWIKPVLWGGTNVLIDIQIVWILDANPLMHSKFRRRENGGIKVRTVSCIFLL